MTLFAPNFLTTTAASPPVEVTLPAINAAVVRHTGHMGLLLTCNSDGRDASLLFLGFGLFANTFVHSGPAFVHSCPVLLGNEAERHVLESDQGSTIHFAQPVLHVGNERV